MNKPRRTFLLVVSTICAISLIITGILFTVQMLPDILAGGRVNTHGQPYTESWTAGFTAGMTLSVDLNSVDVVVQTHTGRSIEIDFEGKRVENGRGEMPYIRLDEGANGISLREIYDQYEERRFFLNWGDINGGEIAGTLSVRVPEGMLGECDIDTFSGNISASSLQCENLIAGTSSGKIDLLDIRSDRDITANTFSGEVTLTNLTAGNLVFTDVSSGSIEMDTITANQLQQSSFSGSARCANALLSGDASFNTSSGSVDIERIQAANLTADTFSGSIDVQNATVPGQSTLSTSSGTITSDDGDMQELSLSTFSGRIALNNMRASRILQDSSSGDFDAELLTPCDIQAETFSGRVTLHLPEDMEFRLNTDTFSGDVQCDFLATMGGGENDFVVGNGSRNLNISTSSGDILVKVLKNAPQATDAVATPSNADGFPSASPALELPAM